MATRTRRQGGQPAISYHITDTTNISKVPMKKLLSHVHTKMELSTYLAQKTLENGRQKGRCVVVAWSNQCQGSHQDMSHIQSEQEEADTKLLLHAVDATMSGATTIKIHSPDTDVLVLALRRYPQLCVNTFFVTGVGPKHRAVPLKLIFNALGSAKAAALPGFHAMSGADNTGSFAGKGKLTCWKAFCKSPEDVLAAFAELGITVQPSEAVLDGIEKFACQLYISNTNFTQVSDVRWWLFKNKQAQSESLPPTKSALVNAIKRAHYQAMVWCNDTTASPVLPSPQGYGWELKENEWIPVMTELPPAPEAVIHLIQCRCVKTHCSTNRCQCRRAGLVCTDMCACSDLDDFTCENATSQIEDDMDDADDDDCNDEQLMSC